MKEQVTADGLDRHFRFRGRFDSDQALAAMTGALAAVMPSRYQEPAGYVPIEAASRGVACILSAVGGLPETAGPDCPSFTAGRGDELARLMMRFLDNPAQALAAGYAVYLRAQKVYSPALVVDQVLGLLSRCEPLSVAKQPRDENRRHGCQLDRAERDAQPEHR